MPHALAALNTTTTGAEANMLVLTVASRLATWVALAVALARLDTSSANVAAPSVFLASSLSGVMLQDRAAQDTVKVSSTLSSGSCVGTNWRVSNCSAVARTVVTRSAG